MSLLSQPQDGFFQFYGKPEKLINLDVEIIMERTIPFNEVLKAVETLSLDEQETLVDIVKRRLSDRARNRLVSDIEESKKEFAQNRCQAVTVESLMEELLKSLCTG